MKTKWFKFLSFFRKNKKLVGLVFLVAILPGLVVLAQTVTKLRSQAFMPEEQEPQSYLMFEPKTDKTSFGVGEMFEVDVVLDAKGDSMNTVVGVDLVINYPETIEPIVIMNKTLDSGGIFESFTQEEIDKVSREIRISASKQSVKNEQGYPEGFNDRGVVATIGFKAVALGDGVVDFEYSGVSTTDDTNVIGFDMHRLVSQQTPKERLLRHPGGWKFSVSEEVSPSPSVYCGSDNDCEDGYSCRVSPWGGCPVMTDENGLEVMSACASAPHCVEIPKLCWNRIIVKTSDGGTADKVYYWSDGCKGKPIINEDIFCTMAMIELSKAEVDQYKAWLKSSKQLPEGCSGLGSSPAPSSTPLPSPLPKKEAQLNLRLSLLDRVDDMQTTGVLWGVPAEQVKGVMIASEFGDMIYETEPSWPPIPSSPPLIFSPKPTPKPTPSSVPSGLNRLGNFRTDGYGKATVVISEAYQGRKMYLFVRTKSHLLKGIKEAVVLPKVSLTCTKEISAVGASPAPAGCLEDLNLVRSVKFTELVPGDIYIAEGQTEQDNVVNSFDVIELIRSLGSSAIYGESECYYDQVGQMEVCQAPKVIYNKADLNGDEVVNTRDLKIMVKYIGQRGDSYEEVLGGNEECNADSDCEVWQYCYQPPMPVCRDGLNCAQVMPAAYCMHRED